MKYAIVTYGTADGKHRRIVDPTLYATREEAEDVIAERAEIGDPAAQGGRMRVEEALEDKSPKADELFQRFISLLNERGIKVEV